jgi:hypothetical protein
MLRKQELHRLVLLGRNLQAVPSGTSRYISSTNRLHTQRSVVFVMLTVICLYHYSKDLVDELISLLVQNIADGLFLEIANNCSQKCAESHLLFRLF